MRYRRKGASGVHEGDMTPMIDMTFQLIAFFMVIVNFAEADQNERIRLPSSELAKPPDASPDQPITLQLTKNGTVLMRAEERSIEGIKPLLLREKQVLDATPGRSYRDATIVIRADRTA